MSSSSSIVLGSIFLIGALLFIAGTALKRSADGRTWKRITWTASLGFDANDRLDVATRLDMIARLTLLGEPWCVDTLRRAASEERDPEIVNAIAQALSRG